MGCYDFNLTANAVIDQNYDLPLNTVIQRRVLQVFKIPNNVQLGVLVYLMYVEGVISCSTGLTSDELIVMFKNQLWDDLSFVTLHMTPQEVAEDA